MLVTASAAAETILDVEADGPNLMISLEASASGGTIYPLELLLLSRSGTTVDSEVFFPPVGGGDIAITLDGDFTDLPQRGWQHRVELRQGGGVLDAMDVRFRLDCSVSACQVVARPDLLISRAVTVDASLAPFLNAGAPVDLEGLLSSDPHLAESIYGASVDLMDWAGSSRCQCFFTADVTGGGQPRSSISTRWDENEGTDGALVADYRWDLLDLSLTSLGAGHGTYQRASLDFVCFRMTTGELVEVITTAGEMMMSLPSLEACEASCSPAVSWTSQPYWSIEIDNQVDVQASASLGVAWTVDDVERYRDERAWFVDGVQSEVQVSSGVAASSSPIVATGLPSRSQFGGEALVSVSNVNSEDRPQIDVAAGAVIEGTGSSECSKGFAMVRTTTREHIPKLRPTTIPVVLGEDGGPVGC